MAQRENFIRFVLRHAPLLDVALQVRLDPSHARVEKLLIDLLQLHANAVEDARGGDAASHQPAAHNPHALRLSWLETDVRHPGHRRRLSAGEEEVHQTLTRLARHSLRKTLLLHRETLRRALDEASFDRVDA